MVVDLLFQEEYRTRKSYIGELSREGNGSRARACRKARSLAISTVTGGEISGGKVGNFQAEKTQGDSRIYSVYPDTSRAAILYAATIHIDSATIVHQESRTGTPDVNSA